jgi:hypothetical protein
VKDLAQLFPLVSGSVAFYWVVGRLVDNVSNNHAFESAVSMLCLALLTTWSISFYKSEMVKQKEHQALIDELYSRAKTEGEVIEKKIVGEYKGRV